MNTELVNVGADYSGRAIGCVVVDSVPMVVVEYDPCSRLVAEERQAATEKVAAEAAPAAETASVDGA